MINLGKQTGMMEEDIIRFIDKGLTDDESVIREIRSAEGYEQL